MKNSFIENSNTYVTMDIYSVYVWVTNEFPLLPFKVHCTTSKPLNELYFLINLHHGLLLTNSKTLNNTYLSFLKKYQTANKLYVYIMMKDHIKVIISWFGNGPKHHLLFQIIFQAELWHRVDCLVRFNDKKWYKRGKKKTKKRNVNTTQGMWTRNASCPVLQSWWTLTLNIPVWSEQLKHENLSVLMHEIQTLHSCNKALTCSDQGLVTGIGSFQSQMHQMSDSLKYLVIQHSRSLPLAY